MEIVYRVEPDMGEADKIQIPTREMRFRFSTFSETCILDLA